MFAIFQSTPAGLQWVEAFDTQAEAQTALDSGDYDLEDVDFVFILPVVAFRDSSKVAEGAGSPG